MQFYTVSVRTFISDPDPELIPDPDLLRQNVPDPTASGSTTLPSKLSIRTKASRKCWNCDVFVWRMLADGWGEFAGGGGGWHRVSLHPFPGWYDGRSAQGWATGIADFCTGLVHQGAPRALHSSYILTQEKNPILHIPSENSKNKIHEENKKKL